MSSVPRTSRDRPGLDGDDTATAAQTSALERRRPALSRDTIRAAALTRFAQQGYHATSLREIASDLQVTVAAIYHHYLNKDEVLTDAIEHGLQADFDAVAGLRLPDQAHRLDALVRLHVLRHIKFQDEALVVHHEAKHLPPAYFDRVRALLLKYEAVFADAIETDFAIHPPRLVMVTKVVLGMGADVVHWFRTDGALTAEQLADRYVYYVRGVLAAEASL